MGRLSDEEILALDSVLIRNNKEAKTIRFIRKYYTGYLMTMSSQGTSVDGTYAVEELAGKTFPVYAFWDDALRYSVRAVVDDVLYVVCEIFDKVEEIFCIELNTCYTIHEDESDAGLGEKDETSYCIILTSEAL